PASACRDWTAASCRWKSFGESVCCWSSPILIAAHVRCWRRSWRNSTEHSEISLVMISRGEPKENRAKVKEHRLTFPVVLQQRWEISRLYAMFATPVAYLIDQTGIIGHDVAVGVEPIVALM